ncbi:helix-turn-helix transcriptional regulator [Nocardia sp. NPDC050435]|uniref:helix-turn-helix domain-containing protein n=1 Tax=Nocardia sp. NPDC050435 TaxID=3155040 RepID=UPI0033D1C310
MDPDRIALGSMARQLRLKRDLRQVDVALLCFVDRTYITHIERGDSKAPRTFWERLDRALVAEGNILAEYDARAARANTSALTSNGSAAQAVDLHSILSMDHLDADLEAWVNMNRRKALTVLSLAGPLALLSGSATDPVSRLRALVELTDSHYDQLGPQAVWSLHRGQAAMADRLLNSCPTGTRPPQLLSIRAELGRRLGWMAYDAGDLEQGRAEYTKARKHADDANDPRACALVLCNWSLLETRDHQPGIGLDHAAAAMEWARTSGDRRLIAYASDMSAEAYAARSDERRCRTALDFAEEVISSGAESPTPDHTYGPGLSAGFRAECLLTLGLPQVATPAAIACVEQFEVDTVSRGFAEVGLANALTLGGEVDEAARLLGHGADLALAFGSPRLAMEVCESHERLTVSAPDASTVRQLGAKLIHHGLAPADL